MGAISFKLETFEGPLDLLLTLVSKHKLDIYDIEIAILLDQYMEYMNSIEECDYDDAGDFLAMAARLVYIKTCSLLPQAQEAQEMKKELEGELIEYAACKAAANRLKELSVYGDVFVRPPERLPINKTFTGKMDPVMLVNAYMGMTAKARRLTPIRAEQFSPIVSKRIVTVTSKIVFVLKKLYKTGICSMDELYDGVSDKSARVATFLAVLELTKSGRIYLSDDNSEIRFNRDTPRRHGARASAKRSFEQNDEAKLDGNEAVMQDVSDEADRGFDNERHSKPVSKYALEVKGHSYLAAVAAVAPVMTNSDEDCCDDEQDYFDDTTESIELDDDCVNIVKINRFSMRCRWGYALDFGNCWSFGRERL